MRRNINLDLATLLHSQMLAQVRLEIVTKQDLLYHNITLHLLTFTSQLVTEEK